MLNRLLKEPFLHFAILGVLIFAWFTLSNSRPPDSAAPNVITIDETDLQQLANRFRATWNRAPSQSETATLLDGFVREEILVREARNLGLERDDAVIRRRLFQKMTFLTTSAAQSMTPEDAVLEAFMQDNAESFLQRPRISFEQVFLGPDASDQDIQAAIAALNGGQNPARIGKASLLPGSLPLSGAPTVDNSFGSGFFDAVFTATGMEWNNPVRSAYGMHLVRVTDRQEAAMPAFDAVRDKVLWQWRSEKSGELSDAQFELIKARYDVVLPDQPGAETGDEN